MADKKKPKPSQNRHTEPRESFHLSEQLLGVLTDFVDAARPATTKSAVIRMALEEFFEKRGMWPSADGGGRVMRRAHSRASVKRTVRKRDGYRCTRCGKTNSQHLEQTGRSLEVRRTTPGSAYTLNGCVTVCRTCHDPEPKRKAGEHDLGHGGASRPTGIRLDTELADALRAYLDSTRPRVSKSAAYETAVREFLEKRGFWPPAGGEG